MLYKMDSRPLKNMEKLTSIGASLSESEEEELILGYFLFIFPLFRFFYADG